MNANIRKFSYIVWVCALCLGLSILSYPALAMNTQKFEFVSDGKRLSGFIDLPDDGPVRAVIVIVHGYGKTEVAGQTSYYDLRSRFTALGIATVIWDKPGCGESEGVFDFNQPVESSAREVLDAVRHVRGTNLPGNPAIGLWGISRAGWIAPIAIAQDSDIAFWISVSGTDDKESFPYLLESNLRIEGRTEAQTALLLDEWRRGFEILSQGGTYEDYQTATQTLRNDPFMQWLTGETAYDEAAFLRDQSLYLDGTFSVDAESGLMVYVPGFADILTRLDIPVLALFGEKDTSVNWRSTAALYESTIGKNPKARLTLRLFPDGNHNIQQSVTGGVREMINMTDRRASEGYYEAMEDWLRTDILN